VWECLSLALVLDEVGLSTIAHYVQVCRQTIAVYILEQPIFGFCWDGERQQDTSPRLWWWEQPVDWDLARGDVSAPVRG